MPKTPNYDFERRERERQKALKKADKLAAKKEAAREKRGDDDAPQAPGAGQPTD